MFTGSKLWQGCSSCRTLILCLTLSIRLASISSCTSSAPTTRPQGSNRLTKPGFFPPLTSGLVAFQWVLALAGRENLSPQQMARPKLLYLTQPVGHVPPVIVTFPPSPGSLV